MIKSILSCGTLIGSSCLGMIPPFDSTKATSSPIESISLFFSSCF
nr:MAG TPA: hypothetical protein [Caudoviricetes sp.]